METLWPDALAGQVLLLLALVCFALQMATYLGVFAPLAKAMRRADRWLPAASNEGRTVAAAPRAATAAPQTASGPSFPPIAIAEGDPRLISVVVCARNEAEQLQANLPRWLDQQGLDTLGLDYELVLVDDGSTDQTPEILQRTAAQNPRLRPLRLEPQAKKLPGKKGPLDLGLRAARGQWVLLTDADCRPASRHWIRHMAEAMQPDIDIVLGVGLHARHAGLLNAWVRFETFHTAVQYLSWTLRGMPYMGVGRNLAYRRSLWAATGGFAPHAHWPSGDDDLTINRMARPGRVAAVWGPDARTISSPPKDWKAWYRQRFRHFSTGGTYRPRHLLALGTYSVSHFGLMACIFLGLALGQISPWWSVLLLLRWVLQWALFGRLMPRLGARDLWHFSTILDVTALLAHGTFVRVVLAPRKTAWR